MLCYRELKALWRVKQKVIQGWESSETMGYEIVQRNNRQDALSFRHQDYTDIRQSPCRGCDGCV